MIMGVISFAVFLTMELGNVSHSSAFYAFEFGHIVLFFAALIFVMQVWNKDHDGTPGGSVVVSTAHMAHKIRAKKPAPMCIPPPPPLLLWYLDRRWGLEERSIPQSSTSAVCCVLKHLSRLGKYLGDHDSRQFMRPVRKSMLRSSYAKWHQYP